MKGLFKFLFGVLIFLVITVGIPVGVSYYYLVDNTDESPTDLYTSSVTFESELTDLMERGFDLDGKEYIDLTFTEDQINQLIFALIKRNNPDFDPNSTDVNVKYIKREVIDLPVLGETELLIKNIYATIVDDELGIFVTMEAGGIKTRAKLITSYSEDDDFYYIRIENLGLGKANMLSGLSNTILNFALEQMNYNEADIDAYFAEQGLPFSIDLDTFSIKVDKEALSQLLNQLINPDDMDPSSEKDSLSELLSVLTAKENDMVDFGVFDEKFGLRFDLNKFQVDSSITTLDPAVTQFDENTFIQNKIQNYIISNLVPTADSKMTFTNLEFNQIVYDQSSGYQAFLMSIPVPNSTSTIDFQVLGILLDFNPTNVVIRVNINLNGLVTSIKLTGQITQNDHATVIVIIDEVITLGEDIAETTADYLSANASLILDLIGDNLGSMGMIQYNSATRSLVFDSASFTQLMAVDGTNVSPLTVHKLKIVDNALEAYAYIDPLSPIYLQLTTVTNTINTVLANNDFTVDDFDTTDTEQAQVVNELLTTLDDVATNIGGGTLEEEDTDALIETFNQLSPENQAAFLAEIETEANDPDLLALYDSLFGR
ncbi:MAG: hypothetical protein RBS25_01695 [Bacilli bacterium]|jgi:hypothetical protein|nr:hypothetical protein [Bacilli bacterium]